MLHFKVVMKGGETRLFKNKGEAMGIASWWAQFRYTCLEQGNFSPDSGRPIGRVFTIWEGEPED